ncbi:MAG: (Fe-S)-binding protein, partial [Candidatus Aminicenantes bacterium]|nr:(Fe-S)-binding protein [Candidatus Aminicenantes bacterium]
CTKRCPENLVPLLLFRVAVEKLQEIGHPIEPVHDFALLLRDLQIKEEDVFWCKGDGLDEHTETILFPGCDSVRAPHEIQTHIDILNGFGFSFKTLWDEDLCCGFRGYSINDFKEGDRLLNNFIFILKKLGVKKVILSCGQCFNQLKRIEFDKYGLDIEIIYFPQLIVNLISKYKFPQHINRKITFHDSCKTARGVRDFDSVRNILGMIPGITIREMEKTRENSLCCGGVKNFSYPEVTRGLLRERLTQAVKTGSDMLVTDCTFCYSMYSILEDQFQLEVKHYSSLISEAMGLKSRPDNYKQILKDLNSNKPLKILYKKVLKEEEKNEYMQQIDLFADLIRKLRALPDAAD